MSEYNNSDPHRKSLRRRLEQIPKSVKIVGASVLLALGIIPIATNSGDAAPTVDDMTNALIQSPGKGVIEHVNDPNFPGLNEVKVSDKDCAQGITFVVVGLSSDHELHVARQSDPKNLTVLYDVNQLGDPLTKPALVEYVDQNC